MQYSLRDLGVLILVCALAAPLLVTSLERAIQRARTQQCADNLKQIGFEIHAYSNRSPQGAFCSGASSFLSDGCVDEYGWVADVHSTIQPSQLIDPSNPLHGTKTLEDLITKNPNDASQGTPREKTQAGLCGADAWKNIRGDSGLPQFAGTVINSPKRVELVKKAIVQDGYNTNYAASWLLTRYHVKTGFTSLPTILLADTTFTNFVDPISCIGPFTVNECDRSRVSSTSMPFLGCAAPSSVMLSKNVGGSTSNHWPTTDATSIAGLNTGDVLAEELSGGPMFVDPKTGTLRAMTGGQKLNRQLALERGNPTHEKVLEEMISPKQQNEPVFLQDTRSWYAVHGGGIVNILMADASVQQFYDLNGDRYINPGFPVNSSTKPVVGQYINAINEIPPDRFFAGVIVKESYVCPFE